MKCPKCGLENDSTIVSGLDWCVSCGFNRIPGSLDQLKKIVHEQVGYHAGLVIQEEIDQIKAILPAWHKRPTGPGNWYCYSEDRGEGSNYKTFRFMSVLKLTAEMIAEGYPFRTACVFGPIPEPPKEFLSEVPQSDQQPAV